MEKILTISVASYNAAQFLDKCLNSIVKSKYINQIEVFVVDDGSTDNTKEVVEPFICSYPDSINYIFKENGGHGSTINISIKKCTAKYFKIVDADDWVETDNLDKLIEFLASSRDDIVLNPYYEVDSNNGKKKLCVGHSLNYDVNITSESFDAFSKHIKLAMHAITFSSKIVKSMGPIIDEHCFYVDTEYILFPVIYLKSITVLNYPIYDYLLGTLTQSMNINNMRNRRNQHLQVVKRLCSFYNDNEKCISYEKKQLIKKRILSAIVMQYVLYVGISPHIAKNELIAFDKYLLDTSKELYEDSVTAGKEMKSGYMKVVAFARKTNFLLYSSYIKLLNWVGIVK